MTEKNNPLLNSVLNMAKKAMAEASKGDAPKAGAKSDNPLELLKTAKNLLEGDNADKAMGLLKKAANSDIPGIPPEAQKTLSDCLKYGAEHKEDIAKIINGVKKAATTMQAMSDKKEEK